MRKALFIHIGPHKTATTSLQHYLDQNSDTLAARGFLYPRACRFLAGHHRLSFAMKGMPAGRRVPDFDLEIEALRSEIAGSEASTALVSSEEFYCADEDRIERLKRELDEFDVRIIGFTRRPDALLLSIYNEKAKNPVHPFCDPIDRYVAEPETLHGDIGQTEQIAKWTRQFGRENCILLRFEDDDPRLAACRAAGIEPIGLTLDALPVNESASNTVIEIMRAAKRLKVPVPTRRRIYRHAVRRFPPDRSSLLSHRDRRSILRHFAPSLGALLSEFGMDNPYEPDRVDLGPERLYRGLETDDLVGFVASVLERNKERPADGEPRKRKEKKRTG